MNQIAQILPPGNIMMGLDVGSKKRVFEQVGLRLESNEGIARSATYNALFSREKLGSTGLGEGVAIPHGRIKGAQDVKGAFVKLVQPIPFDAPDGLPVDLLFVMLVPEASTEYHLQLLSELAQMFSDSEFRDQLRMARDVHSLHDAFTKWYPAN